MRASEFIAEDLSRRGFLRGLGAAGATAATGGALAKKPVQLPITGYYPLSVQSGQTIYSIARSTMTDPKEIMKLNGFTNTTRLEKGQVIKIPQYDKNPENPLKTQPAAPVSQKHAEPANTPEPSKSNTPTKTTSNALEEPGFIDKLVRVSQELGVSAKALFGIIKHESHFRHHQPNPYSNAIGLIQFMPRVAEKLGTNTQQLSKMSAIQQLDYVYKYLKPKIKPGMDIGDMYMAVFMPAYVGAPNNTVLGKKGGGKLGNTGLSMHKIWEQNPPFSNDLEKPYFTVGDVKRRLATFMPT